MNQKPRLLAVPNFLNSLTVKADLNGVTVLRDGRYKKRYLGSKQFAVDINGNLRRRKELEELVKKDRPLIKKLAPRQRSQKEKMQDKPTPKLQKSFRINKPEIRARIFTKIAAQPPQKKELYFWTVSFPAKIPDSTIYRLFNTWLTKLRQKKMISDYLWICERQTGERLKDKTKEPTNTLHFHLAIPHRMNAKAANREMMVTLCNAAKNREIDYNVTFLKRYNGVHISKNQKTGKVINFAQGRKGRRSLTGYLTKYVTKNESSFSHLAWHNSRGFSMLFTGVTFTFEESRNVYQWRFFAHSRPAVSSDYFYFFPWINGPPPNLEGELLKLNLLIQNLN